jgi:hypothetical protein
MLGFGYGMRFSLVWVLVLVIRMKDDGAAFCDRWGLREVFLVKRSYILAAVQAFSIIRFSRLISCDDTSHFRKC